MKRSLDEFVCNNTRSKRPKLYSLDDIKDDYFISATSLFNHITGDAIVDWFKLSSYNNNKITCNTDNFTSYIMKRGVDFEKSLIQYLKNKHEIVTVSDVINDSTLKKTKDLMFQGVPIIHSAPLRNDNKKLQGVADLLVRSDYINEVIDIDPLKEDEITIYSPTLKKNYYYIVIDIKFSTLPLRADNTHILNSQKYAAYKAQCLVYTEATGLIQGYTAPIAFILGRRNKNTKHGIPNHNYSCINKIGRISYDSVDKDIPVKMNKAIRWLKDVRKYGKKWITNPPSRLELYPNMCIDSGKWNKLKQNIADDIGEITKVWNVGIKNRKVAFEKGIKSLNDKNCTSKTLNITGKRAEIIDSIININNQSEHKVLPKVITNNINNWKLKSNEVFVDFETISDIFDEFNTLPFQKPKDLIFMIGVGYVEDNEFIYKNFCCEEITRENEFKIMNEFNTFLKDRNYPKMYCWCAEENFWRIAEQRQFDIACSNNDIETKDLISDNWEVDNWVDLYVIFQQEPIVIKNCYKFGLKNIAKALYEHKLIFTKLDSNCDSGLSCMVKAWEAYNSKIDINNSGIMSDIKNYNKFDCKILWEILNYLRINHT